MKIAVSGKGGVGRTTIVSLLAKAFSEHKKKVLVIDADPDANLITTLGFPDSCKVTPVSQLKDIIEERTGAKSGGIGVYFKLNPKVDDLPEKLWVEYNSIKLMVMGQIKKGGTGCYCPESVFLKALMTHLLLARDEVIILDMEAGIEHLGRGTAKSVNKLIVVVEPGRKSLETAARIKNLAKDIGLYNLGVVGNKVRNQEDKDFLLKNLSDFNLLGFIPYSEEIITSDKENLPPWEQCDKVYQEVKRIAEFLKDEEVKVGD